MPSPNSYKLSPSDLTFLWDECPRCFYLKVRRGFPRPAAPFPSVFGRIDRIMKDYFRDRSALEIFNGLPEGVIRYADGTVTSGPIGFPGLALPCYITGRFDTVLQFDQGGYAVVDFKTSEAKGEHVAFYSRQLHAYAYALENPRPGGFSLSPIVKLGLLSVEPDKMDMTESGRVAYLGKATWQECPLDMGGFIGFINQVAAVLNQPDPPSPGENCGFCAYREKSRLTGY